MTFVQGQRVRSFRPDLYADITDVPATAVPGGIEFDGDLTVEQQAAIYERMTSKDDVDQAKRATLRADRDALAADDPLRRLYDYMLGD